MVRKRGQVWSIEMYVAVAVFLLALVLFYSIAVLKLKHKTFEENAGDILVSVSESPYMKDNEITSEEIRELLSMSCTELRKTFGTNKDICIYFKDNQGIYVNITENEYLGIGCEGLTISNVPCGNAT